MKFGAWGFTWVWSFCPSTVWHKKPTGHNFLSLLYRLVQPNSLARASICPVMSTVNVRKIFKEYPGSGSIGTASNRFWADFFCLAACPAAKAPCTTPALHQWSNGWLNLITWYIIYTYHIRYARSSCLFRWLYLVSLEFHVGCEAGCGLSCNDDQAYHVQFGHAHNDTFGLSQTKRKLLHISTAYCPCIENYSLLLCCLVAHLSLVDS
jgi:hypothetical protein